MITRREAFTKLGAAAGAAACTGGVTTGGGTGCGISPSSRRTSALVRLSSFRPGSVNDPESGVNSVSLNAGRAG